MIDMIGSVLSTYGVLGLWTCYLIYEKRTSHKEMSKAIENNTESINRLVDALKFFKK